MFVQWFLCSPIMISFWIFPLKTFLTVTLSTVLQLCTEYQYFMQDRHSVIINGTMKGYLTLSKIAQTP